jgi:predicted  nucleic acid-binding Zn-ribbon protein
VQTNVKEQRKLVEDANKKIAKLQKQVEKLKADLEEERARVRPPSPQVCFSFTYIGFKRRLIL